MLRTYTILFAGDVNSAGSNGDIGAGAQPLGAGGDLYGRGSRPGCGAHRARISYLPRVVYVARARRCALSAGPRLACCRSTLTNIKTYIRILIY